MNCIYHSESFIVYTSTIDFISCRYNFMVDYTTPIRYEGLFGYNKTIQPLHKTCPQ